MNPPSIILGGVHGKVCWLIAYLVVTSLSMLMLGYSGGLDGLASSHNLKCIWYLAFNLPNSHLIAGKRMQLLRRLC